MILAKDKNGHEQTMTEKELLDAQRLLPQYKWVKVKDIEEASEIDDLVIEIIDPIQINASDENVEKENEAYIEKMKATYPRGWNRKNEFIDDNGVIYEKGKLVGKKED